MPPAMCGRYGKTFESVIIAPYADIIHARRTLIFEKLALLLLSAL